MSQRQSPEPDRPEVYQIRLRGQLAPMWSHWFDGLALTWCAGDTLLTGPVPDQAALHGLIRRTRDLGLPLLSVTRAGTVPEHGIDDSRIEPDPGIDDSGTEPDAGVDDSGLEPTTNR